MAIADGALPERLTTAQAQNCTDWYHPTTITSYVTNPAEVWCVRVDGEVRLFRSEFIVGSRRMPTGCQLSERPRTVVSLCTHGSSDACSLYAVLWSHSDHSLGLRDLARLSVMLRIIKPRRVPAGHSVVWAVPAN